MLDKIDQVLLNLLRYYTLQDISIQQGVSVSSLANKELTFDEQIYDNNFRKIYDFLIKSPFAEEILTRINSDVDIEKFFMNYNYAKVLLFDYYTDVYIIYGADWYKKQNDNLDNNKIISINDKLRELTVDIYDCTIRDGGTLKDVGVLIRGLLVYGLDNFGCVKKHFESVNQFLDYKNYFIRLIYSDVYEHYLYLRETRDLDSDSFYRIIENSIIHDDYNMTNKSDYFFDELVEIFVLMSIEEGSKKELRTHTRSLNKFEYVKKANPIYFLDGLAK